MTRFMNWSNMGTVNAVSPWLGLHTMPLVMSELRTGASDVVFAVSTAAMVYYFYKVEGEPRGTAKGASDAAPC